MRIEILPAPLGNTIAREIQVQGPEGTFHLKLSGHVVYRSPHDRKEWPAGQTKAIFVAAVQAWNIYCEDVTNATANQEEIVVVDKLRRRFTQLGLFQEAADVYWTRVLSQVQDGLL